MLKSQRLLNLLTISLLVASCAKELPQETLYKDSDMQNINPLLSTMEFVEKGDTEGAEFLYVPNTQGIPSFTESLAPFVQGNEKIVKMRFTKNGLMAYEVSGRVEELNRDKTECKELAYKCDKKELSSCVSFTNLKCTETLAAKLKSDDLEIRPILTIGGTYKSFKCAENSLKECTNKEEENNDLEWHEKSNFIPDFSNINVQELDSIGLPDKNSSCFTETGTRVTHKELTADFINIELEKTYKFSESASCINQLWYSSNGYEEFIEKMNDSGSFNARVFFSFARLDKISSPNYKKITYPLVEHGSFGFFKSGFSKKDLNRRKKREYVLNRWNPDKNNGVIDYHLSSAFFKPANKHILDATKQAFNQMNKALKLNKVKLGLNLVLEDKGVKAGDLRFTMLNLIEDIASSLLGYGPTVANPRTGEIVKGHTNMYKGSLDSFVPQTYDGIRDHEARQKASLANVSTAVKAAVAKPSAEILGDKLSSSQMNKIAINLHAGHEHGEKINFNGKRLPTLKGLLEVKNRKSERTEQELLKKFLTTMEKSGNFEQLDLERAKGEILKKKEIFDVLHRNSVYTADMFNFQTLGKQSVSEIKDVKGIRDQAGVLKPWQHLTKLQQSQLTKILVVHSYVPTLIHEIGHNLGLRHNFAGSADKENFYTEVEAKALGMKSAPAYSSIMDYAYSGLNNLSSFGKYDIAALKFAYNREVESVSGQTINVASTPLLNVRGAKRYNFCTDENAGSSLTCNRFDEGSNELEIVNHLKQKYNDYYQYYNVKNRRTNFNESGNFDYLISLFNRFSGIRNIHEQWQGIHSYLQAFPEARNLAITGCTPEQRAGMADFCNTIDQTMAANNIAARMLLDIAKTQDLTCHIVASGKIGENVVFENESFFLPIGAQLEQIQFPLPDGSGFYRPHTCFDANLKAGFEGFVEAQLDNICKQVQGSPTEECKLQIAQQTLVFGETGKSHNDVSSAPRFDQRGLIGDIEIRGTWIDKIMSMWFLTSQDKMTTAGAGNQMSFASLPEYKDEIYNLMEHFAYGAPIKGNVPYTAFNGTLYQTTEAYSLNLETAVPRSSEMLRFFLNFPDSDNYKIGPVMQNMALKVSKVDLGLLPNDLDVIAKANEFHKSISVYSNDQLTDSSFGTKIVKKISLPEVGLTMGATADNKLALNLMSKIDGTYENETTAKIEAIKAKVDEANRIGPTEVEGDNETETEGEGEGESESDTPVIVEEVESKAGIEMIERVIELKKAYNASFNDINLIKKALSSATSQEGASANLEILKGQISEMRFDAAISLFVAHDAQPAETAEENELRAFDLYDLEFYLSTKVEKASKLKAARNGLYMLIEDGEALPL